MMIQLIYDFCIHHVLLQVPRYIKGENEDGVRKLEGQVQERTRWDSGRIAGHRSQ